MIKLSYQLQKQTDCLQHWNLISDCRLCTAAAKMLKQNYSERLSPLLRWSLERINWHYYTLMWIPVELLILWMHLINYCRVYQWGAGIFLQYRLWVPHTVVIAAVDQDKAHWFPICWSSSKASWLNWNSPDFQQLWLSENATFKVIAVGLVK